MATLRQAFESRLVDLQAQRAALDARIDEVQNWIATFAALETSVQEAPQRPPRARRQRSK